MGPWIAFPSVLCPGTLVGSINVGPYFQNFLTLLTFPEEPCLPMKILLKYHVHRNLPFAYASLIGSILAGHSLCLSLGVSTYIPFLLLKDSWSHVLSMAGGPLSGTKQ